MYRVEFSSRRVEKELSKFTKDRKKNDRRSN